MVNRVTNRFEYCDDWGIHREDVARVVPGFIYFKKKAWDGHELRFNVLESRVEQYLPDKKYWDVFVADVFQAGFID